jgi:iron complex outermembrane recepter protein
LKASRGIGGIIPDLIRIAGKPPAAICRIPPRRQSKENPRLIACPIAFPHKREGSMSFRIHPLVAALAIVFSPAVLAQAVTVDRIEVSGSREAGVGGRSVLNAGAIAARRAYVSDAAQLLNEVPGVSLFAAGGVSSLPAIHGLADDRLRITVDGMDFIASCPNHMNPPLSYLNPSSIENIKVFAGITPVSVGGDSIGGSIVAETRAPEFAAPGEGNIAKGEVGAFYRSNNKAIGANLSATGASENFNVTYTGGLAKADNYTAGDDFKNYDSTGRLGHTLPRDEVGSTAYETRTHTLGLAMKGGNQLIEAKFGYQEVPEQLYPNQRMDMLDNTQKRFNLRYLGQFDWGTLSANAYHEKVDHFMDFGADKRFWYGTASGGPGALNGTPCSPISTACAAGMPMYSEARTTGFNLKADLYLNPQDLLRLGGQFQRYRLDDWWPASGAGMFPGTFTNINDGQRDRTALFGEWESTLDAHWTTLFGLRYERVRSDAGDVRGYNPDIDSTSMGGQPPMFNNQKADADAFNARQHARTDNNWNFTALARYTVDAEMAVEFGFARKVRSPNLYERYTWSTWSMAAVMNNFAGDGNGYIGNLDLEPEKAHTLSATLDWHAADRAWGFKATPYFTQVQDYIDVVRCTSGAACYCCKPDHRQPVCRVAVREPVGPPLRHRSLRLSAAEP